MTKLLSDTIDYIARSVAIWFWPSLARTVRRGRCSPLRLIDATPKRPRQLLVDVSIIVQRDAGTGIQRVVRSLIKELLSAPPSGFEIKLVSATRKSKYRYADRYLSTFGMPEVDPNDAEVVASRGDVFLGLDLTSRISPRRHGDFKKWQTQGVRLAFVVYDLLPIARPDWFTPRAGRSFRHWLTTLAINANALFCISNSVALETQEALRSRFGIQPEELPTRWFHLGTDLPRLPRTRQGTDIIRTILMVGTIEPRKGHTQILDAFETLWHHGRSETLIIAGRAGWNVKHLINRIEQHPEIRRKLLWLPEISDRELAALYANADGLIMASEGEGFGLPLIEAAQCGTPVFARDIAVFREVAGEFATYFSGKNPEEFLPQLETWLNALASGKAQSSSNMPVMNWQDSYRMLKAHLVDLVKPD
ncbi:glycosyltransferase family 4 protein [Burkholderia contaminans]|uniref:glycosyltransferase family 4 protein n=1 Tax=Burkholderia contaminans TaxID=488447 RepID=UPI001454B40A|nr:glycosyltransferase family 1 protein [Burkholderia contaminans]MCA8154892.1 glycosyltransferase family 4 protein [Burkholderia contaminans]VWD34336.1 glycosyltransferase [Burkholderia contaminans]